MKHRILIRYEYGREIKRKCFFMMRRLLRRAICSALELENVKVPCEVNILITDDEGIRSVNNETRQVDKPTDVLSFPMYDFIPGAFNAGNELMDPQTGMLPLGDMVLSIDRIRAQAQEFGHSLKRETAYLAVHSVLHMLGYDHIAEGEDKRKMRLREEEIMKNLHIQR